MIALCGSKETFHRFLLAAVWFLFANVCRAVEPAPEYLSGSLADRITTSQEWGILGFDTTARPADGSANKIRIKNKQYERGLGQHANGEILVALEGQFQSFHCEIGLQWSEGKGVGGVIFEVYVDGNKVFDSGVVRENDSSREVNVSVEGADELRLVATDIHGGVSRNLANWADARLVSDPTAKDRIVHQPVDIAAFAQIVTSDPKRMSGTEATRVQEIPAEDVFLETELTKTPEGNYAVPMAAEGPGCIGLRWYEMRHLRRLEIHWADASITPPTDAVQLQYWVGVSAWQGQWKPLAATIKKSQNVWSWRITSKDQPTGTVRVRWVFQATEQPLLLKAISAYSRSSWNTAELFAELNQPMAGKQIPVSIYNGALLGSDETNSLQICQWDLARPLGLKVCYSKPRSYKADRTVLRFMLPDQTVSVAVEDVLSHGSVYVPSVGLFVTGNPPKTTLAEYLHAIADKTTVLEQVRRQPDQSLSQAMAKTHNPIQNMGPMLLSLACDNRKFIAERNGSIRFDLYDAPDSDALANVDYWGRKLSCWIQLVPQLEGKGPMSRHLDGGWLPKPITSVTQNGVTYQQCTYVAPIDEKSPEGCPHWYRQRAACVAAYTIENTRATEADVVLKLSMLHDSKDLTLDGLQEVQDGLIVSVGDRLLAYFDASQSTPLSLAKQTDAIVLSGKLAAGKSVRLVVYLPAWPVKPANFAVLSDAGHWATQTDQYWKDMLAESIDVDVPNPLLTNTIRASQVHCLLAARNEDRGRYISPWISSDRYGPLESESQAVIRGMDMCGNSEFARRGLEFFLKRYNSEGFLTTGYTMIGTGEHLWTLAEHYARCRDQDWLEKVVPQLVQACQWIAEQRAKTKKQDAFGNKVPEYGLMPPGVTADWGRFAYRFYNDAQYCYGLQTAAQALSGIGYPDAPALLADAKEYREDLLRAYRWTQAHCPVVPLGNGTWVPNHPSLLDVFGNVEEMVPAEDANRSWCYSVEIGSHHLAANRLLNPLSAEVTRMMDYLEDYQFLRSGWFDYSSEQNHKDIFNLGGFGKVQPYYARNAEVYALRDEVKPFIRSYFNAMSALLNEENLSFWEHFHNTAGWNKTHETGWFLCQTAIMFTMERGDNLWLAPFVTNNWLKDGMTVAVRNAPTRFGPVGYSIVSHVNKGYIEASIEPPKRNPPKQIVIRIRHPEDKPMKTVTVDGKAHTDFDPATETIRFAPTDKTIEVRVEY